MKKQRKKEKSKKGKMISRKINRRAGKKKKIRKLISKRKSTKKINKKISPGKIKKKTIGKRIPTGIAGFDKLISRGFEEGSINLLVGGEGSGKTIFAMQFLIEGVKRGENILYITFEESKEEFFENMSKFGWDIGKLERDGKFTFLEYSPEKIKMMLDEGGGAIESIIYTKKIKRMIIDSISSFSLLFREEQEKRHAILALFNIIKKWDCTTLLTLQKDPSERDEENDSSVEYHSDSLILLYFVKIKDERERFIEVVKMRGTKHSTGTYRFDIGKKGIKIGKKTKLKI